MVNDWLLFSVSVLVFLVIILMLHLSLKTASLLSECSECRTKCDNLYHLCQMQEEELEWICPYISRHLLSLNPLLACCRRYSRGER
ncbi:hypothetical protein Y804_22610 [Salmonella enterica subsp. enterica serovar Enteritidis]|nr:hypothetical protein [Salmonella enterica subsp. enterica serovar Enteritidis]ECP3901343.1 hypothetical protein [Salmonella enterica]EBM9884766.1 hypothetical protein [Salmonella enterica subsp. enterica serovar Enteritidis]ECP4369256.1 hypothetical protein [Salmonella enterica]ECQ0495155.1 hypothetical protein [Salmonella enterica]